jgi:hypothetical protein
MRVMFFKNIAVDKTEGKLRLRGATAAFDGHKILI